MAKRRRLTGWLAVPAFVAVLLLIGMAVSTEPREEFESRSADDEQTDQADFGDRLGDSDRPRSDQASGRSNDQDSRPGDELEPGSDGQPRSGRSAQSDQQPIIIQTENGTIVVEFDADGNPVRVIPGDSRAPTDPGRVINPGIDSRYVGFRVTDDGLLELVEADDFLDSDFRLWPSTVGLDITRPDGTEIRLRPTSDGVLTGAEVTFDGNNRPLIGDDGAIIIQSATEFGPDLQVDPRSDPIIFDLDAGPVRINLQENGDLVANQPNFDDAVTMDIDDLSAIRVDEDGNLEIVPLDEIGPDDTVLVPNENGFDLVQPDGTRIEFRPDGENDGITATEISPDGEERELTPNPDGSVTLGDGTTVGPIDIAEDGGTIEQLVDQTSDLPWPWLFAAIAALTVLSVGTAVYLHRNRPRDNFDYSQFTTREVPEDQFERFLTVLLEDPDPNRSIRLAFYAVERGMAGLPPRRADETPFEWHARVALTRTDLAAALAPICDLFAMARFAPGQATTSDQGRMVSHLRNLNSVANRSAEQHKMAGV